MKGVIKQLRGFTLIEVLIALAVIGIAFAALGFVQLTNLQASSSSRLVTETKSAANSVLEDVLAEVLLTAPCTNTGTEENPVYAADCDRTGVYYAFNDFYWTCPTTITPLPPGTLAVRTNRSDTCIGSRSVTVGSLQPIPVQYVIRGESDTVGQGVLSVQVTATHPLGSRPSLTIGDRITCFDVYPTPTSEAPAPCPDPTVGGR